MTKKIVCLMLVLSLAIVTLAGCSQKTGGPEESNTAATAKVTEQSQKTQGNANSEAFTVTVDSWFLVEDTDPGNPINQNYKDAVDKAYKKKYPNATVQWDLTISEKYFELLRAKLASGTADDVFFHQGVSSYAKGNYLADLSSEPCAKRVVESTRPGIEYESKLYGIVRSLDGWAGWYNKKMFEEKGWKTPKTWDEFLTLCETIKTAGIAPIIGGFKNSWTLAGFLMADSVDIFYENPNWEIDLYDGKVKYNGPEYQNLFTKLATLAEKGYYNQDCLSIDWEQSRADFEAGKAAIMFMGDWLPVQVVSECKDFETGFFLLPDEKGNTLLPLNINQVVSVNSKAKDMQKAKDLLEAIIDKDAMEIGLKNNGFSGVNGVNPEYTIPGAKEFAEALQTQKSALGPGTFQPASVSTVYYNISTKIFASKKFDPSMLDEMDKTYQLDKNQVSIPGK